MPDNDRKLRVFLCHASHDKPVVRELYQRLLAEGWIDPWLDAEKLLPGQDWDMEIKKAVKSADAVIVCVSSRSTVKEGYIQKEIRFVLDIADEKPDGVIYVVPLRLDDCTVPDRLMSWHYVDFFPKDRQPDTYQRLLDTLTLKAASIGVQKDVLESHTNDNRLRELLDSGMTVTSGTLDLDETLNRIAETAKGILRARFVHLMTFDQLGSQAHTANAGIAPDLKEYLSKLAGGDTLLAASMSSLRAIRVRDIRKLDANIILDGDELRSFIAIPIRLNRVSVGAILAFGKDDPALAYSEEDEALAMVISIQAGMTMESLWLYKELRVNLSTSNMLFQTTTDLLLVEDKKGVFDLIVQSLTQFSLTESGGLVALNDNRDAEFVYVFEAGKVKVGSEYPSDLVAQALDSNQHVITLEGEKIVVCVPLQTKRFRYGAFWLVFPDPQNMSTQFLGIMIFAAIATQAIERLALLNKPFE